MSNLVQNLEIDENSVQNGTHKCKSDCCPEEHSLMSDVRGIDNSESIFLTYLKSSNVWVASRFDGEFLVHRLHGIICGQIATFYPITTRSIGRRSSSVTKWGSHITRERFDLESPNFIGTSTVTLSISIPDMTSLSTSGRKLYPLIPRISDSYL